MTLPFSTAGRAGILSILLLLFFASFTQADQAGLAASLQSEPGTLQTLCLPDGLGFPSRMEQCLPETSTAQACSLQGGTAISGLCKDFPAGSLFDVSVSGAVYENVDGDFIRCCRRPEPVEEAACESAPLEVLIEELQVPSVEMVENILRVMESPALAQDPDIAADFVVHALEAENRLPDGRLIDPLLALAVFQKESNMGKNGVATRTLSVSNIRFPSSEEGRAFCTGSPNAVDGFCAYASWGDSVRHFYWLLTNIGLYADAGLTTWEEIVPIYDPSDPGNYTDQIRPWACRWRRFRDQPVTAQLASSSTAASVPSQEEGSIVLPQVATASVQPVSTSPSTSSSDLFIVLLKTQAWADGVGEYKETAEHLEHTSLVLAQNQAPVPSLLYSNAAENARALAFARGSVALASLTSLQRAFKQELARLPSEEVSLQSFTSYLLPAAFVRLAPETSEFYVETISGFPMVERVFPSRNFSLTGEPAARVINAAPLWTGNPGATGAGVTVAVIDTGLDYTHLDFGCSDTAFSAGTGFSTCAKVPAGVSIDEVWINQSAQGTTYSPRSPIGDPWPELPNKPRNELTDDEVIYASHGTLVAGIAGGKHESNPNNSPDAGEFWGVAPDATLVPVRLVEDAVSPRVLAGAEWLLSPQGARQFMLGGTARGVVNFSVGSPHTRLEVHGNQGVEVMDTSQPYDGFEELQHMYKSLLSLEVVPVVGAGNDGRLGPSSVLHSNAYREAFTVGAVYTQDYSLAQLGPGTCERGAVKKNQVTCYSARGPVFGSQGSWPKPDVVAPGTFVCAPLPSYARSNPASVCLDNTHYLMPGTSAATPMVAGAVALARELHPAWSAEEIVQVIKDTAVPLVDPDTGQFYSLDTQGWGLVNMRKAAAVTHKPPVARLEPLPNRGIVPRVRDIRGRATGENFGSYRVDLCQRGAVYQEQCQPLTLDPVWVPVRRGGVLVSGLDFSRYPSGEYTLRLLVKPSQGFQPQSYVARDYIHITVPRSFS